MSDSKLSLPEFYGIKAGMTRIFDQSGNHVPVTVVKLVSNIVSQVKTKEKDGYTAYQVAYGEKRESLLTQPVKGKLKKASISKNLCHFSEIIAKEVSDQNVGKELSYELFPAQTYIDVCGESKGKGTQGVMKKFNFQGGPASHGSHFHRRPGSIGCRATPARVWRGKKMPGLMGNEFTTVQNLQVVEVNPQEGYMLIKGSLPGGKNSFVKISKAIKKA